RDHRESLERALEVGRALSGRSRRFHRALPPRGPATADAAAVAVRTRGLQLPPPRSLRRARVSAASGIPFIRAEPRLQRRRIRADRTAAAHAVASRSSAARERRRCGLRRQPAAEARCTRVLSRDHAARREPRALRAAVHGRGDLSRRALRNKFCTAVEWHDAMNEHEEHTSMTPKNTICLWFDKDAREAASFYADTFPDSKVTAVHKAPSDYPGGKKGDELTVEFTVLGVPCLGLNGGPAFRHNEAFSFQVATDNQEETDRYWNAIVGNGGKESACGWCKDRWGVSWQITPRVLTEALAAGGDEAKRAFEAMMPMKKI